MTLSGQQHEQQTLLPFHFIPFGYSIMYNQTISVLYSTLLCCTLLYSVVLYSTLLCCTLLCCTLLCCTLLYSVVLYSTLLYSTLLYTSLLYSSVLHCAPFDLSKIKTDDSFFYSFCYYQQVNIKRRFADDDPSSDEDGIREQEPQYQGRAGGKQLNRMMGKQLRPPPPQSESDDDDDDDEEEEEEEDEEEEEAVENYQKSSSGKGFRPGSGKQLNAQ